MVELAEQIKIFMQSLGLIGGFIGCILIMVESILPVLPLFVFITINFLCFGHLIGFIISWIFTIIGCIISYKICNGKLSKKYYNKINDKETLNKYTKKLKNMSLGSLTVLIAIPFTPAFLVNIASGILKMDFKKFITAIAIGKIALVYFWGYIGTSLIESISNPKILIEIVIIVLITYIISLIINKVLKV